MTPPPTITTVIPTYRRPHLLRGAIESALNQTYPHVKVLVCDNASGDETPDVVAEIARRDPRVVYHCHARNIGPMANYQFGLDAVDTEYFSLFADDDLLIPGFYRHAVDAFAEHPEAKFFCGQSVFYDQTRGTHSLRPHRLWREGFHEAGRWTRLMFHYYFAWTSCVMSSSMRPTLGPLNPIAIGDILYLGKAAACFPFVVRHVPCCVYVITGKNCFSQLTVDELRECDEVMQRECAELPNISESDRDEIRALIRRGMRVRRTDVIRAAIEQGDKTRLAEAADYCREQGDLNFRRRLRVELAQRGGLPLIRQLTRFTAGYKRLRRSRWRRQSLEQIVAYYSGAP